MKTNAPFDGEIHAVSAKKMPDLNSPKRGPGWFLGEPMTHSEPAREAVAQWRYSINYSPDGEANYANVHAADGQFVGNLRTHHAIAICNAFAVCEKLASPPAPDAGGLEAVREALAEELRQFVGNYWRIKTAAATNPVFMYEHHARLIERTIAALASPAASPASPNGAIIHAIASLAAAVSLLERTPKAKKAAPSDRMFEQMLCDYRKALEEARAALASPAATSAETQDDLVSRAEVIRVIRTLGDQDADLALYGAADNARAREYGEAAATRACCAIALMPRALAKAASEPAGGDVVREREIAAQEALARIRQLRDRYADQAKFACSDEAYLFLQFVERLDRAALAPSTSAATRGDAMQPAIDGFAENAEIVERHRKRLAAPDSYSILARSEHEYLVDQIATLSATEGEAEPGVRAPISTAPKDGTWFVAEQDGETYPCEWAVEDDGEGGRREGWFDHLNHSFEEPTHWWSASPPSAPAGGIEKLIARLRTIPTGIQSAEQLLDEVEREIRSSLQPDTQAAAASAPAQEGHDRVARP